MKVWVVIRTDGNIVQDDSWDIVGIWDSEQQAESNIPKRGKGTHEAFHIEEHEVKGMSNQQFRTPGEVINDITNQPVATARSNVDRAFRLCEKELAGLELPQSNAVFSMLQATQQMRNQVMQGAIQDHQAVQNRQRELEAAEAQKRLEAEQEAIAKANQPHLTAVGAPRPQ